MDEFKMLFTFNFILLGIIFLLILMKIIKWYIHLPIFLFYNLFFAYKFIYDGSYGQGFAWVFLGAIFSLSHLVLLITIFFLKRLR